MIIKSKVEFLGCRAQKTKEKGEALIMTVMDEGAETYEIWVFDEDIKKKAKAKKRGEEIELSWQGRKFKGYLQVGSLVGVV